MSFLVETGQTWVCLGDSITQAAPGYVSLIDDLIHALYPERSIQVINAGIGGNKTPDIVKRLEKDVLAHEPDWVSIKIGINDVWHGLNDPANGVELPRYTELLDQVVLTIQERGAKVILVTPTVIGEDVENEPNAKLAPYAEAVRTIASERGTFLADARTRFIDAITAGQAADPEYKLTTDGVHLRPSGNALLATTILETVGFFTR